MNKTIWLLEDGEQTPLLPGAKKMRTWLLADALRAEGFEVVWWASTFCHFQKKKLVPRPGLYPIAPGFSLFLLEAGTYQGHFSLARLLHHARLGKAFLREAPHHPKPLGLVAGWPVIELAHAAVSWGTREKIPVIIDVRDQWPDSFEDYFAKPLKPLIRLGTRPLQKKALETFQGATALTAMSRTVLTWALGKCTVPPAQHGVFFLTPHLPQRFPEPRPPQGVHFLFLGTFGRTYDFQILLKALAEIPLAQGVRFTIAGDGPQRAFLERHAAGLPLLSLLGWQDQEKSHRLMAEADVILCPFKNDAVPNKFIEALAWGKPCFVFAPHPREAAHLLREAGAGLTYHDVASFLEGVATFCQPEPLARMKEKASAFYRTWFEGTYPRFARFVLEVFGA